MKSSCHPKRIFLAFVLIFSCIQYGQSQKLKILPLGNSITYDYSSDDDDGSPRPDGVRISYRYQLYQLLNGAGYTWDYVGNEQCGSSYLPYSTVDSLDYTDNAGFPGMTPAQIEYIIQYSLDPNNADNCLLDSWVCPKNYFQYYNPDIILLHIGTNELTSNAIAVIHRDNVDDILDLVDAYETYSGKTVPVFLAQIINRESVSGDPEHAPTIYYNSLLSALVSTRTAAGDKVVLVNMETGAGIDYRNATSGGDMYDALHPAPSGYTKIGTKWFSALENYNLRAPVVTNIPDVAFTELQGSAVADLNPYVFDPQDPDNEMTWSVVTSSVYFNITYSNGVATITPKNPEAAATETITFRAQDSGNGGSPLNDTDAVTITYTVHNDVPVIQDRAPFVISEDGELTLSLSSIQVTDADNVYPDDFTLFVNAGANYSLVNTYTVKPTANFNGTLTVPVYVNDGNASSAVKNLTVTINAVNDEPWITLPVQRSINEDADYNVTITTGDPDAGDVLTLSVLETLPSWLTFNAAAKTLSGIPQNSDVGTIPLTIRVNDGHVNIDSSFVITVNNTNDLPTFTSNPASTDVYTYEAFEYTATATDIDPTGDILEFEATEIPSWLQFNAAAARLFGTPANDHLGNHNVTLRVTDGTGAVYQNFILKVVHRNYAPVITSVAADTAVINTQYLYALKASDIENDALAFASVKIPGWTTFYTSGILIGTPQAGDTGINEIILSVSDGENTTYDSIMLHVVNDPAGLKEKTGSLVTLYPNPASSRLYIEHASGEPVSVMLIDIRGKTLPDAVTGRGNNPVILDIQSVPPGFYLLRLQFASEVVMEKILIQQ